MVWDSESQTFHGGQDWKFLPNFIEDFSVTTNGLGTPVKALEAAKDAISNIHHYPPADFQPSLSDLANFLWPNKEDKIKYEKLLLLGNGASELIDLVIRSIKEGGWRPGRTQTQYKEYERSATANGRKTLDWNDSNAVLTCLVNPTNPTGDYLKLDEIKSYIETYCPNNHTIIIDESMQPWIGPNWRNDSLIKEREWVSKLVKEKYIKVWIITSWTKIWSCTGIRLGSVVAPTINDALQIKQKQVPWSVNTMALAFLSEVVQDNEYLIKTWEYTPKWNTYLRKQLNTLFPNWVIYGQSFLSWLWIDTKDENISKKCVQLAKDNGMPVRYGAPGYELPTYIRIAVRSEKLTDMLLNVWKNIND